MAYLGAQRTVRFVEIDSMGNEREIGTAKNYNVSSSQVMNPISGFGSNQRRPETEVTIEVEDWKTPQPTTAAGLVSPDVYNQVQDQLLLQVKRNEELSAFLQAEKAAREQDKRTAQGLQVILAAMVHMMGGSVIVHQSELTAAGEFDFMTAEQPELNAYIFEIKE